MDPVAALQTLLDECGDGWTLGQCVVIMGLGRLDADGNSESTVWLWLPSNQPEWMTDGLITAAKTMRESSDID